MDMDMAVLDPVSRVAVVEGVSSAGRFVSLTLVILQSV